MKNKIPPINYDESWKYILTTLFKSGLDFFYNELFVLVDFTKPVEFIESKLTNLDVGDHNNYKNVDKLIKCSLLDGNEQHILLHIEIEANNPYNIAQRMFIYYCALKLKFPNIEIQSLIIYLGEENPINWHLYHYKFMLLEITYKCKYFNIADVKEDDLLKSNNPFAYMVLFTKWLFKNKQTMQKRFTITKKLFLILKDRKIDLETIKKIFVFINKLVSLTNEMEKEINIIIDKKHKNMYGNIKNLAQVEAIDQSVRIMYQEGKTIQDYIARGVKTGRQEGIQKGKQEGIQEGIQKGKQEGIQEGMEKSILNLHKKGYKAPQIADLLDFELAFVEKIIDKK